MRSLETHKTCGDVRAATTGEEETESVMCAMAL